MGKKKIFSDLIIFIFLLLIVKGCGGGGGGGETVTETPSTQQPETPTQPEAPTLEVKEIKGFIIDDFVLQANIRIFKVTGEEVQLLEPCISQEKGYFSCKALDVTDKDILLVLASGGILDKDGNPITNQDSSEFPGMLIAFTKPNAYVIINPFPAKIISSFLNLNLEVTDDKIYLKSEALDNIVNNLQNLNANELIQKQEFLAPVVIEDGKAAKSIANMIKETFDKARKEGILNPLINSIVVNAENKEIKITLEDKNIISKYLDLKFSTLKTITEKLDINLKEKVVREVFESLITTVQTDIDSLVNSFISNQITIDNVIAYIPIEIKPVQSPTEPVTQEEEQIPETSTPPVVELPPPPTGSQPSQTVTQDPYSPTAPVPVNGWYEEVLNFNGKDYAIFTITIPPNSSYYIVAESSGNTLLTSEIIVSQIVYYNDASALNDVTVINPETTNTSIAKIKISNSANESRTYKIPVALKSSGRYVPGNIWVAAISVNQEEINNPNKGGELLIGDVSTNVGEILIEGEQHIWTFSLSSQGTYKLIVDTSIYNYKNPLWVFTLTLIDSAGTVYVDENNGYTTNGSKELILNLPQGDYRLIIKSSTVAPDALGYYSIKLIKQ